MGLSAKLFFDPKNDIETLFSRVSLNSEQMADAKNKKDTLLEYLKPELSKSLDMNVKHWLQGSYKNHTVIRPVSKGKEFDIDVGVYLFCNAEEVGLRAIDAKNLNREKLKWFTYNYEDSELEDSKNSCERLIYPASFHIDIPLYCFDENTGVCRLATQDDGWLDSDPKALQDWFDASVDHLKPVQLARLRRTIKYLKAWVSLKWKDEEGKIPSVALTVLVATYYVDCSEDDDAFIETASLVLNHILENDTVESPVNGDDLLGFDTAKIIVARKKARALKNSCNYIKSSSDSFHQFVLWSGTFEHLFPPFAERLNELEGSTNLPATSTPPRIRVRHLNKSKSQQSNNVTESVSAYIDENLYFSIDNQMDFGSGSEIHWMVRNQDKEASTVNDLGHIKVLALDEECYELCSYSGTHYMECLVINNGDIKGISAVKVRITGFTRPVRNPPRKRYFKGKK